MIRLIYVSRAPRPPDLKGILETSRRNNERAGITGALCYLDDVFLQYLEGPAVELENLYRRIVEDPRHSDAKLLTRTKIESRHFANWAMALVTWNHQTRSIFNAFVPDSKLDLYKVGAQHAAIFFESMARSSNWQEV